MLAQDLFSFFTVLEQQTCPGDSPTRKFPTIKHNSTIFGPHDWQDGFGWPARSALQLRRLAQGVWASQSIEKLEGTCLFIPPGNIRSESSWSSPETATFGESLNTVHPPAWLSNLILWHLLLLLITIISPNRKATFEDGDDLFGCESLRNRRKYKATALVNYTEGCTVYLWIPTSSSQLGLLSPSWKQILAMDVSNQATSRIFYCFWLPRASSILRRTSKCLPCLRYNSPVCSPWLHLQNKTTRHYRTLSWCNDLS